MEVKKKIANTEERFAAGKITKDEAAKEVNDERYKQVAILDHMTTLQASKLAKKWRKDMLLDRKRVCKIIGCKLDQLIKYEEKAEESLDEGQLTNLHYLMTFDRGTLKQNWPLKKAHDRRNERAKRAHKRREHKNAQVDGDN